jgi:hypothetical protein
MSSALLTAVTSEGGSNCLGEYLLTLKATRAVELLKSPKAMEPPMERARSSGWGESRTVDSNF